MRYQTATEYLIIVAVVIIISLIVVTTLGGVTSIGSSESTKATEYAARRPVSIVSWTASQTGGTSITFTTSELITLDRFETACLNVSLNKRMSVGEKYTLQFPGYYPISTPLRLSYLQNDYRYLWTADVLGTCNGLLQSLIGFYRFEGNEYDASRKRYDGSLLSNTTSNYPRYTPGYRGLGLTNDGGLSTAQQLLVGSVATKPEYNFSDFTIATWAYATGTGNMAYMRIGPGYDVLGAFFSDGFQTYYGGSFTGYSVNPVTLANWSFITMTLSSNTPSNATYSYYVNGILRNQTTVPLNRSVILPSSVIEIAGTSGTLGQKYQGTLDEMLIWNRSLSAAEVTQLYNGMR
jgi:hypothetical protein